MLISLTDLKKIISAAGIKYFRDDAPEGEDYPYLVYEYVGDRGKRASNKVVQEFQEYQLAYITEGIESELNPLKELLNENGIAYSNFHGGSYDENDEKVTQFVCYVRCINAERL